MSAAELAEYKLPELAGVCLRAASAWTTFAEKLKHPAFEGWGRYAHAGPSLGLIQFFPPEAIEHKAQHEAARIARVLGGAWTKEGENWSGVLDGVLTGFRVLLHRVEPPPAPKPEGPAIDLTRYPEGEE